MFSDPNKLKVYRPNDVLDFGKFTGKTVETIVREDVNYLISLLTQDTDFFISEEDLSTLSRINPSLVLDQMSQSYYEKKLSIINHKEFRSIFMSDPNMWDNLRETNRSRIQRERYPSELSNYVRIDYNDPLEIAKDIHTWKFIKLSVDEEAIPMIEVYCYSVRKLSCFSGEIYSAMGYAQLDFPVHYFMFSLNMNHYDFGYLARTLIQNGLAELKSDKEL